MQSSTKPPSTRGNYRHWDRILGIAALIVLIAAWFIGGNLRAVGYESALRQTLPDAALFQPLGSDLFQALGYEGDTLGYVAIGKANGYGGPMQVAVAIEPQGQIVGLAIIEHKETPSFFARILKSDLVEQLLGVGVAGPMQLDVDIDAVTGATYTSAALAESVREASRKAATQALQQPLPPIPKPELQFRIPEITLVALFALGFLARSRAGRWTIILRWGSMLVGLLVLGFIYNRPLTLSKINTFLLGYWPDWRTDLYWYLLLGGVLLPLLIGNKNPYCEWFCPFGAAQECMGAIGGAKPRLPRHIRVKLRWLPRGLAFAAIVIALLLRNPGVSSYEIFGTLFDLTGSLTSFAVLGIVLITSIFVHRVWCHYLCPLNPVTEYVRMLRKWVLELWQKIKNRVS